MKKILLLLMLLSAMALSAAEPWTAENLSDSVFQRMQGLSWPRNCSLQRSSLRHLTLLYCDAQGQTQQGEMVVNSRIADKIIRIFRKLYEAGYRIERMRLIDDYGADDERSMSDNNTSCFCYRKVANSKSLSKHAQGLAIDLNPRYNPCVSKNVVQPSNGKDYAYNRDQRKIPYKIDRQDLAYRLFRAEGFRWGGDWHSLKDYQHFEY